MVNFTQRSIWEQINIRARFSPIHFYQSAGGHDWKTGYPYFLLKANASNDLMKKTRRVAKSFMIDSLGMGLSVKQQVEIQRKYNVDIYITNDEFKNPIKTTELTVEYLLELVKQNIFNVEIMVIIQGDTPKDYINHFNELLIITTNAEQCINCKHNQTCEVVFRQTFPRTYIKGLITRSYLDYHNNLYEPIRGKREWRFRFGIGGLIQRKVEDQEKIIDSVIDYGIKSAAFTFKDIYPKREREIMVDTKKGKVKRIEYDPIQFHVLGVGVSTQIFPTIMKNQPFIMSFDSKTPSQIAVIPKFLDKNLRHFPVKKEELRYLPYENLTFREQEDDVGDVSALNALRGFYNIAMLLYAMESKLKLLKENEEINMIKRYIKYHPKYSQISQKSLEKYFEAEGAEVKPKKKKVTTEEPKKKTTEKYKTPKELGLFNFEDSSYREKVLAGFSEEEIIEDALKRWTTTFEKTGEMTTSLALLHGLIIFGVLDIREVVANIPIIKSPQAVMNKLTIGYKIMEYPICEDIPEYFRYKNLSKEERVKTIPVLKAIRIRHEYIDLVLKYLLKSKNQIKEYKKIKGW